MGDKKNTNANAKVDEKGSLGLLAYGDLGLREWRAVKALSLKKNRKKNGEEK